MSSSLRLVDGYQQLVEVFMERGEVEKLAKALILMSEVVDELIRAELAGVGARLTELFDHVKDVKSLVEKLSDSITELSDR